MSVTWTGRYTVRRSWKWSDAQLSNSRPAARGRQCPSRSAAFFGTTEWQPARCRACCRALRNCSPKRLADHMADLRSEGVLMPGAVAALRAVHAHIGLVPTVLTGNLKPNATLKLEALELDEFVDVEIGGYASDSDNRPALVAIAQKRATAKHGAAFHRSNTVIIGDSLEDVRTGLEGGASCSSPLHPAQLQRRRSSGQEPMSCSMG
ncbi:haloacid dehalogenase-like hydrolase [Streptomyces sp. MS1.AVA.3]|uniref:haloacid dehalogenase-like hydrolase n=1 Tax=Streptomyces decoyicus TaxID=249567 RepID=UPI0030BF47BD